LIILAGETAIMDRYDIAPRAVERAGGKIETVGAPVDPGNLLMLAYLDGVPVLGAPGCVRSPKTNVVDWVLPRLLAGDRLSHIDIVALGHGGLLDDIPERPVPRKP
jgi:molybdenum cofactor cytidylyltransferase